MHLISFDFNEFLEPVDEVDVMGLVVFGDVARVKPAVVCDRGLRGDRIIKVSFHDLHKNYVEPDLATCQWNQFQDFRLE